MVNYLLFCCLNILRREIILIIKFRMLDNKIFYGMNIAYFQ